MSYTIKEVSEMTGLPVSTLRYYDKEGLLPMLQKKESGYRVFHDLDLETLRIVECFKKSGMEIKDIKQYMELFLKGETTLQERYEMLLMQRQILEDKRAELDEAIMQNEKILQSSKEALDSGSEEQLRERARELRQKQLDEGQKESK